MNYNVPNNARLAARVILLDNRNRILYFKAIEPNAKRHFWVMPGGGLKNGETFENAAIRETFEETGLSIKLGPWVWFRRHKDTWGGKPFDQYERFFVAWTSKSMIRGDQLDRYIVDHRWWAFSELQTSKEDFVPRQIRSILPAILQGKFPKDPLNCGV